MSDKMPNFRLRKRLRDIAITAVVAGGLGAMITIPIIRNMVRLDTARKVNQSYTYAKIIDLDLDGDLDLRMTSRGIDYSTPFCTEDRHLTLEDIYFLNDGNNDLVRSTEEEVNKSWSEARERAYTKTFDDFLKYADRNKNGALEFGEQVDAWRRMGFGDFYIESNGKSQFQKPSLSQLEEAIASYKAEEKL